MTMTMTIDEIRAAVLTLLKRIAPEADTAAIAGDEPIRHQIDLDSMDSLNILAGLAEVFAIEVPECDYGRLQTLDDMVAYVAERRVVAGGD